MLYGDHIEVKRHSVEEVRWLGVSDCSDQDLVEFQQGSRWEVSVERFSTNGVLWDAIVKKVVARPSLMEVGAKKIWRFTKEKKQELEKTFEGKKKRAAAGGSSFEEPPAAARFFLSSNVFSSSGKTGRSWRRTGVRGEQRKRESTNRRSVGNRWPWGRRGSKCATSLEIDSKDGTDPLPRSLLGQCACSGLDVCISDAETHFIVKTKSAALLSMSIFDVLLSKIATGEVCVTDKEIITHISS